MDCLVMPCPDQSSSIESVVACARESLQLKSLSVVLSIEDAGRPTHVHSLDPSCAEFQGSNIQSDLSPITEDLDPLCYCPRPPVLGLGPCPQICCGIGCLG